MTHAKLTSAEPPPSIPVWVHVSALVAWVCLLGFFFANVEVQIEGDAGWAANLPTWHVSNNRILNILWEGKPVTGYHLWVFSFMALTFHLPLLLFGRFSWKLEARILACIGIFWVVEDCLWFILNPAFGLGKLNPQFAYWHKHWVFSVPLDYPLYLAIGTVLLWYSFRTGPAKKCDQKETPR